MAYTYLIGWSKERKFYYGVRYSKKSDPSDLWVTYFTSSKYVKMYREEFGEPDIIQIRRIFNEEENAIAWEEKVLRRMKVVERSDFLNRWDNNMIPINLEGPFPFEDISIQGKVDITIKDRYGARGSASPIIKAKVEETNMKKYGVSYTTQLVHVKEAREKASIEKFGTLNPFENPERLREVMFERHGVKNMMHAPEVRAKHKKIMEEKDWSLRNEKSRQTNLEKYGVSCAMNRPEIQEKHKRSCPFGCKDGHRFMSGNFTNHMKKVHKWTAEQIKEYKDEN